MGRKAYEDLVSEHLQPGLTLEALQQQCDDYVITLRAELAANAAGNPPQPQSATSPLISRVKVRSFSFGRRKSTSGQATSTASLSDMPSINAATSPSSAGNMRSATLSAIDTADGGVLSGPTSGTGSGPSSPGTASPPMPLTSQASLPVPIPLSAQSSGGNSNSNLNLPVPINQMSSSPFSGSAHSLAAMSAMTNADGTPVGPSGPGVGLADLSIGSPSRQPRSFSFGRRRSSAGLQDGITQFGQFGTDAEAENFYRDISRRTKAFLIAERYADARKHGRVFCASKCSLCENE